ncbi:adenylyltransferase/cytidyltransferase family protein [Kushneria marisflavi]|uniref:Glycerol-3-phosphate cytidylyltransferase n=1 Tax=Kushneria marisflavi TaxID=157779 RepID=A0A240UR30_9GAMM|nr:adenylyltransferase/cytidyltransferase family protein [Kushneria marisflavi]ART63944.1 glycerol-3-phosphate cytidylyltransferase [Kushneria marisflavi]RKD85666.1 glycerol-3-phosphate cytidylyltransferase [Kushneria marisflavi]
MKTIITYGTFDMFHIGHLNLLETLASMGGRVIVGVSTDEFNEKKGKKVLIPYEQRARIVKNIKFVDEVIPEFSWEQKRDDVVKYGVDIFAIGEDWKGEFDFLSNLCEVKYLPRTRDISTTELKKSLKNFLSIPQEDLIRAFEVIELLRRDLE